MATKQGYLKEKGSQDKLAPKTLDSLVKDSARNRALSASLQELAERQCLGYPPFATTQNYAVGDKVFYDRKLWKFTSTHAAGTWNASHVTAWSVEDEVSELKLAVTELDERKANIDGFYEGMGVGVAKRLEGNTDVVGSFLERTTGGDAELANGLAQLNEVQGGSVKFNQLVQNGNFSDGTTGWISNRLTLTTSDNIASASNTSASNDGYVSKEVPFVVGHIYLFSGFSKTETANSDVFRLFYGSAQNQTLINQQVANTWERKTLLFTCLSSTYRQVRLQNNVVNTTNQYKNINIYDLTAIFGEGNEPSTVAEFETWLAQNVGVKDYYEYTAGVVVNNNMTGIESNGFNLFNPTTGKARIIGAYSDVYGNYYGITGTYGTLTFEDDLGNVSTITPDADGKFELDVSGYLSVADAGNDVAVFLWWDGKKTEYEDYDVDVAHLDVRHIYGKKNGTGDLVQVWPTGMPRINNVIDKLCIEKGAVVAKRVIQEFDLGNCNWSTITPNNRLLYNTSYFTNKTTSPLNHDTKGNLLCSKYNNVPYNTIRNTETEGIAVSAGGTINVGDNTSYASPADFKTAMAGVLLYYELATPETYTDLVYMGSEYFADDTPVALPVNYKVDNWGVESILPKNTSTILTAKPTIKVRYAIDAVEQLNTHSDEIEDLYDGLEELDGAKANTVGVYDDMVVGAAKAIAGNHRLDKEFTSMVVEGADCVAKINEVRGKSLVWNQLLDYTLIRKYTAPEISISGRTISIVTESPVASGSGVRVDYLIPDVGHKYLVCAQVDNTYGKQTVYVRCGTEAIQFAYGGQKVYSKQIITAVDNTSFPIIWKNQESTALNWSISDFNIFDLTQMFGAGNEPATVAEFEALFPDAYYEYNDGEIINNATEELDVTGFNQWDEEWELGGYDHNTGAKIVSSSTIRCKNLIPVLPNTQYRCTNKRVDNPEYQIVAMHCYNKDGLLLSYIGNVGNMVFTTPSECFYLAFNLSTVYGTTYNHDICINISDASRNGTYEPYKHGVVSLNLSTITGKQVGVEGAESVVIFPDGMRQAGSVADTLIVDDDGYARRALVKTGSVDLGTLTWQYNSSYGFFINVVNLPSDFKKSTNGVQIKCNKFETISISFDISEEKLLIGYSSYLGQYLFIHNSDYSDAATFKAAMSGVELIYEIAEYKEYTLDEPILMTFRAYHGGTIVQSPQAPDSAPMSMNVTFALDAVGTLNNLPKNYISADSMDAFLAQLGTAMNGTWTKSWDAANNRYGFTFTPNTQGE